MLFYINKMNYIEVDMIPEPEEENAPFEAPTNIFINDILNSNKFELIDSCINCDVRNIRDSMIKLINISTCQEDDVELDYEIGDIYRQLGTDNLIFRMFLDNGTRIIKYNMLTEKYKIVSQNMHTFNYNKNKFKMELQKLITECKKEYDSFKSR